MTRVLMPILAAGIAATVHVRIAVRTGVDVVLMP